jgi:hypothetical protein
MKMNVILFMRIVLMRVKVMRMGQGTRMMSEGSLLVFHSLMLQWIIDLSYFFPHLPLELKAMPLPQSPVLANHLPSTIPCVMHSCTYVYSTYSHAEIHITYPPENSTHVIAWKVWKSWPTL